MASGRDLSYTSPAKGYQGRDMTYNDSGEYTNQGQQMRHDEFIDQVSTFPGQNDQEYLQQIKTEEYLNQRNNMSGQGTNILQQTGEGVVNAAQGAVRGAANMAQGAASAVKHTLGMDNDNSPHYDHNSNSTTNTGGAANYAAAGTKFTGDPFASSGAQFTNNPTGYGKRHD